MYVYVSEELERKGPVSAACQEGVEIRASCHWQPSCRLCEIRSDVMTVKYYFFLNPHSILQMAGEEGMLAITSVRVYVHSKKYSKVLCCAA